MVGEKIELDLIDPQPIVNFSPIIADCSIEKDGSLDIFSVSD